MGPATLCLWHSPYSGEHEAPDARGQDPALCAHPPPPPSALGPSHNLLESPGVSGAAFFALSHLTPRQEDWAWDDSPAIPETRSQHLALAGYFGQAGVAAAVRGWVEAVYVPPDSSDVVAMNYPVALLYFTALGGPADVAALQRHAHFAAQHTFSVRSSWSDPGASFIAWQVRCGAAGQRQCAEAPSCLPYRVATSAGRGRTVISTAAHLSISPTRSGGLRISATTTVRHRAGGGRGVVRLHLRLALSPLQMRCRSTFGSIASTSTGPTHWGTIRSRLTGE